MVPTSAKESTRACGPLSRGALYRAERCELKMFLSVMSLKAEKSNRSAELVGWAEAEVQSPRRRNRKVEARGRNIGHRTADIQSRTMISKLKIKFIVFARRG